MNSERRDQERYTHGFHEAVVQAHSQRTAEDCAAFLIPSLSPESHLLDVGCGPGTITAGLGAYCHQVTGVDAEPSMLEQAATHARDEEVHNVSFEIGSAYDLRWPDQTFDVVYAHQVLQHLGDPVAALREFRRVLKPGGLVAVRDADYETMVHSPVDDRIVRWRDLIRAVTKLNGGEADAGRYLLGWVQEAGFSDPIATSRTWTYADPVSRSEWGELWAQRITKGTAGEHAIEAGLSDATELCDIASAFREWAAQPDGVWYFIHGEVLAVNG